MCIKCWDSAFHTQIWSKFLTLRTSLKQQIEARGWKEAQRQGDDRVTWVQEFMVGCRESPQNDRSCIHPSVRPSVRPWERWSTQTHVFVRLWHDCAVESDHLLPGTSASSWGSSSSSCKGFGLRVHPRGGGRSWTCFRCGLSRPVPWRRSGTRSAAGLSRDCDTRNSSP